MKYKNHLLCVTGLTPQVVTETLYAIHDRAEPMPVCIHILTTKEGAERLKLTLIGDKWLARFFSDYQLSPIITDSFFIHVLNGADGKPLQDIRSQADNQSVADGITEKIRELTIDDTTALHVSIAGGRKTMGFYAGYALSLYGRTQDRLSHVLVSADYESHPQFYYPTPYSHVIYANDPTRKPLDTHNAKVILADIPFVRLRHGLDNNLLHGKSSFIDAVQRAQQSLNPPQINIDLTKRCIQIDSLIIKITPADLAFYIWLLQRQLSGFSLVSCPNDGAPEEEYATEYIKHYQNIIGECGYADRTLQTLKNGMSKAFFEQRKSRINRLFKQTLQLAAAPYLISPVGKRPKTRYQIMLRDEQIKFLQEK